jgi:predicted GNAT family acetyltransferase
VVERLGVREFLERGGAFLLAREAEHNLILGLATRLLPNPRRYGSDPYLAVVEAEGRVVAAALRTPPYGLILSEIDDARAIEAIAADVHDVFDSLPGVLGPVNDVRRFVDIWQTLAGVSGRLAVAERIYQADSVTPRRVVPGRSRPYCEDDRELAVRWCTAFVEEALPDGTPERPSDIVDSRLTDQHGGLLLWEDLQGEPVSLAGFGSPTSNGVRVGPVYTPPELRGRGYASALVAELTASLLAGGRRYCFLFTNLANPTSNSIYQQVGYRPVTEVDQWLFD